MWFNKGNEAVVYATKNSLTAYKIEQKDNKPSISKKLEADLSKTSLTQAFKHVKKKFGAKTVRLLLAENQTYLELVHFDNVEEVEREQVLARAKRDIPANLNEETFDWKIADKEKGLVQILAVNNDYLNNIEKSAIEADIKIEAFEPPSFALARQTANEDKPHIVVWQGEETVVVAAHKGQVFESITLFKDDDPDKRKAQLKKFVKHKWNIELKKEVKKEVNPIIGLFLKEDIKGKDEDILNLKLDRITPEDTDDKETQKEEIQTLGTEPEEKTKDKNESAKPGSNPENSKTKKILLTVITILLFGASIAVLVLYFTDNISSPFKVESPTPPETAVTETDNDVNQPEETVEEETLNKSELSIEILNGIGTPGAADQIQSYLAEEGYTGEIATGNADSFDYEETEIYIKESMEKYFELLVEDLGYEPDEIEQQLLEEDYEYDIQIILGGGE